MPLPRGFLQEMGAQDQFVLAFPRSGSRWMVRLLSDLMEAAYGLERGPFYERYLEELSRGTGGDTRVPVGFSRTIAIPDAHHQSRQTSALLPLGRAPVFRSHHLAEIIVRANGPIIYLARHPGPTLYSYYHYARGLGHIPATVTLQDFCEGQLPFWKSHVSTMLELHRAEPGRVLFRTYQEPGPFVREQLEAAASHFEVPFKPETVDWAMGRLAAFLPKLNAHSSTSHARGVNHALMQELPEDLRHWMHSEAGELYEEVVASEQWGR